MTTPTQTPQTAPEHQAAQATISAALARQLAAAWDSLLAVNDLKRSLPVLSAGIAALVQQYGSASAGVAADYYDAARAAAAVRGSYTVRPAAPPDHDQVDAAVRWATKGLWSAEPQAAPAKVLTQGVAQRLVLSAGRDTITAAVAGDRKARGWARHAEPDCCAFCAMLATRGEAYVSEKSAAFEAHDHDRCTPEPVFGVYEPPAHVREWKALYRQSTRKTSGQESVRAFRAAYDGKYGPAQGEGTPHGG